MFVFLIIIAAFIPGVRLKCPCWSWALSPLVFDSKNVLGSDWALFLEQIQILEFHLKIKVGIRECIPSDPWQGAGVGMLPLDYPI